LIRYRRDKKDSSTEIVFTLGAEQELLSKSSSEVPNSGAALAPASDVLTDEIVNELGTDFQGYFKS